MSTEHTNAVDAASTVSVAREKCLQTVHYSLLGSLDRFLSHWAHPRVWLPVGEPKPSPTGRTPYFGTKFCSWTFTGTTSACSKYPNEKCALHCTFSHLISPLSEEISLPGNSQAHSMAQSLCSFPPSPTQMPKSSPRRNPPCDSHPSSTGDRQSCFQPHLGCHFANQTWL